MPGLRWVGVESIGSQMKFLKRHKWRLQGTQALIKVPIHPVSCSPACHLLFESRALKLPAVWRIGVVSSTKAGRIRATSTPRLSRYWVLLLRVVCFVSELMRLYEHVEIASSHEAKAPKTENHVLANCLRGNAFGLFQPGSNLSLFLGLGEGTFCLSPFFTRPTYAASRYPLSPPRTGDILAVRAKSYRVLGDGLALIFNCSAAASPTSQLA